MACEIDHLSHYGIAGQKWGVRRFQNEDGTLTEEGRDRYRHIRDRNYALRTHDDVERIFKTFSKKDKRLLDASENDTEYMSREATAYWVHKRFLEKDADMPVAFLDIIKGKNGEANIAIGTHSDYRGRGYATRLAKKGSAWIDKHSSDFTKINWGAFKENTASIYLAKKNGFKKDRETENFVIFSKGKGDTIK